jgi:hypothetical protein
MKGKIGNSVALGWGRSELRQEGWQGLSGGKRVLEQWLHTPV